MPITQRTLAVLGCAVLAVAGPAPAAAAAGPARAAPARVAGQRAPSMRSAGARTSRPGCPRARYGPRYYAPGRGRTVALTFDDGPGASTRRILSMLVRRHVAATFFNSGRNERARWWLVKAEARGGFALGNHTWDHPYLPGMSRSRQASQIDRASAEQRHLTGYRPCSLRPPYGAYNRTTLQLARHRGMNVWLWSVDPQDWKAQGSGSSYWVHRITGITRWQGGHQRHPLVLLHNQPAGNPATVRALPAIIRFFRRHHYRFVRL